MLQCSHMGSVNKVILIGNLGKDAETKFIPSGTSVTTFNLATTRKWKDQQSGEWKEQTDWHRVKYWRAENVANYLLKGKQVYVEGRLETRSYDDKDGKKVYTTEVVCEHLGLLDRKSVRPGALPISPTTCLRASRSTWKAGWKPEATTIRMARRSTPPKSSASTSCFWAAVRRAAAPPPTNTASSPCPCRAAPPGRPPLPASPRRPRHPKILPSTKASPTTTCRSSGGCIGP